ncbi:MAG: hypothetical protein J6C79_05090 [Clostridia bacterium]|nr:hypothetical protein [Clostridia bacterium]
MEDIIEKIYKLEIEQNFSALGIVDKEIADKEWEKYNELYEKLPKEAEKLFLEYISTRGERECQEMERAYTCGFKTATRLFLETLKK